MTYHPPDPTQCFHLRNDNEHCLKPSVVVVTADFESSPGIGACFEHVRSVLMFQMERERGGLPERYARVIPAWRWLDP